MTTNLDWPRRAPDDWGYVPLAWTLTWDEQVKRWPCVITHNEDSCCEKCSERMQNVRGKDSKP
jgi:hypothetical protein